jgi:hypothetical protein
MNSKNKNSNVSHASGRSAQLMQNFSMEAAAKNLKFVSNQHLADKINNVTRNSNLQSQPNKEKLVKQM